MEVMFSFLYCKFIIVCILLFVNTYFEKFLNIFIPAISILYCQNILSVYAVLSRQSHDTAKNTHVTALPGCKSDSGNQQRPGRDLPDLQGQQAGNAKGKEDQTNRLRGNESHRNGKRAFYNPDAA